MMFLLLPLLFLIPMALVWLAWSNAQAGGCCGASHAVPGAPRPVTQSDPIDIARQRLARGEITPAEFEEIRRVLG